MKTEILRSSETLLHLCHNLRDYALRLRFALERKASQLARAKGALTYTRIEISDEVGANGIVRYTQGKSQYKGGRRWKTIRHAECVVVLSPRAFALKNFGALL